MPTPRQIEVAEQAEKLLLAGARSYTEIARSIYGNKYSGRSTYVIACISKCGIFNEAEAAIAHNMAQPLQVNISPEMKRKYAKKKEWNESISSKVLDAIGGKRMTMRRLQSKLPNLTYTQIYNSLYKMGITHLIVKEHEMTY